MSDDENVHELEESEDDDDHDPSPPGIGADMTPDKSASLTPGTSPASA